MATVTTSRGMSKNRTAPFIGGAGFLIGLLLLAAAIALALAVKGHHGPWPDDVNIELADQHVLLPHHLMAVAIEQVSRVNWPTPAGIIVGVVFFLLLLLRRWLDALTAAGASIFGDLSSYLTNQFVQRPRPEGHGIAVLQQVTNYFSFPSGHVVHVIAFFGVLLFLTFQTRRWPALTWLLRIVLLLLILLIGPSRVMEGEHWPTDVIEGFLIGSFWLVVAVHWYWWAGTRWPHLLAPDEREARPSTG